MYFKYLRLRPEALKRKDNLNSETRKVAIFVRNRDRGDHFKVTNVTVGIDTFYQTLLFFQNQY